VWRGCGVGVAWGVWRGVCGVGCVAWGVAWVWRGCGVGCGVGVAWGVAWVWRGVWRVGVGVQNGLLANTPFCEHLF
jgi:hypothetical protein